MLVVGAGGLGSPVITYLTASGVGQVTVVDDDVVSLSNLQRQVIHSHDDLDREKAVSAADRARALNPFCRVEPRVVRLDAHNALTLLAGHDLAVDATDSFASARPLAEACAQLRIPLIYGAVLGWEGQLTVLEPGRTLESIFGPLPDDAPSAVHVGVLSPLVGVIGAAMAVECLKVLAGVGTPLVGRLGTYDARSSAWRTLTLPPFEGDA